MLVVVLLLHQRLALSLQCSVAAPHWGLLMAAVRSGLPALLETVESPQMHGVCAQQHAAHAAMDGLALLVAAAHLMPQL